MMNTQSRPLDERLKRIRLEGPFEPLGMAHGEGHLPLEVVLATHTSKPNATQLRSTWKKRLGGRGVPLLLVVRSGGKSYVCGPSGDDPRVYDALESDQVERICIEALDQPGRLAAQKSLRDSLGTLEDGTQAGLRNEGFLAAHELTIGVPDREDWTKAGKKGGPLLRKTGKDLLTGLGFSVDRLDGLTSILKIGNRKSGVAVLLESDETPEGGASRFPGKLSPVSYALARADEEGLDWVILTHGRKIRLYPVKVGMGVGRRGRTETWIECHTALLSEGQAAYLWLLFSADALKDGGSLDDILGASRDFAGQLATQLRERIYEEVIPRLAEGLANARGIKKPTSDDLATTYQMAMRVLFRILFTAYGEDKDLLPCRFNGLYQKRSLKAKAKELQDRCAELTAPTFDESDGLWSEVCQIFKAIDKGNTTWGVPAYNGGLFASDAQTCAIGAELANVSLPDSVFGPALIHLLLVPTHEGVLGPVDFRALGVREFGTIYEGLLESELSVAEQDLTVEMRGKNKDAYRPAKDGEDIIVPKGTVYLHNSSGARKSSGSYYTKSFAVEHLLDRALEPAIDDHFARLDALEELEAGEQFFDFRVADIAMGSAHFLVAAIDRIEVRFSGYLAKRPLPLVAQELDHLRSAAKTALGDAYSSYSDIEDTMLLRRQIARRCIYGVDLNEVAVQLARLAIWVHTFVPGLPLSLLDRTLVHGNSLVGIGTLDEIEAKLREDDDLPMFPLDQEAFLGDAAQALGRLAKIADATKAELAEAKKAWADAEEAVAAAKAVCDILTAARIEDEAFPVDIDDWDNVKLSVSGGRAHAHAKGVLRGMSPLHFPIAFPEVFLRKRSGFDVLLGNPPWEKAISKEDAFWPRFIPGFNGYSQREQEVLRKGIRAARPDLVAQYESERKQNMALRSALNAGPYPGMGTGDPDLYKAFCWRFWHLAVEIGGRIGVVLPRTAWVSKGSAEFRQLVFTKPTAVDLTVLVNRKGWVFPGVHEQNPVPVLNAIGKGLAPSGAAITVQGPFMSLIQFQEDRYYAQSDADGDNSLLGEEVMTWTDSASLPLLPNAESLRVFAQIARHPRLDSLAHDGWRARPYAELHSRNDKDLMDLQATDCPPGHWPVYKGESFHLWEPDSGITYGWADPSIVLPVLQAKRVRARANARSPFSEFPADAIDDLNQLPCLRPRICIRKITNRTNRRTIISSLVPPEVFLQDGVPFLLFPSGGPREEAFLLGILSSVPFDWYARTFVEINVTYSVLNPLRIPSREKGHFYQRATDLAGRLACPDDRFADWAKEVGVECGPLEEDTKQDMIHELDAVVAHLYGLSEEQLVHVFETFHVGWDYQDRLNATLKHFADWKGKA